MRYPSKKGWFSYLFVIGPLLFLLGVAVMAILDREWLALPILALAGVLNVWLWVGTYYEFREHELFVKGGPFRWKIPYDQIKTVQKTRSLVSGPALSLDRIEIIYKMGACLISPVRETEFLEELQKRNPLIRQL
ncbi:PH domain-containing protein [Tumebacillus algifaecis]|nr:PH domain-containing protein [Tumebacillus algifaecis]